MSAAQAKVQHWRGRKPVIEGTPVHG
jgi:hypothetical protein